MAKRKTLSYEDKVKLIEAVNAGDKKKSEIAKQFGIPANTLSTIIKKKEKYESQPSYLKRIKGPENKEIDNCVVQWLKQCRNKNLPISGPTLQEKATEFTKQLGKPNFRASNGWLQNFKKRNDVVFKKVTGESASVNDEICTQWCEKLSKLTKNYKPEHIFNADETGLFYQCLPDKTLTFKGDACHGGKNSKQRITVLLGANQTGTVKLKPLVIGKSKNPRCFKGIRSFPTDYTCNRKAWMKSDVFGKWLSDLDKQMIKKEKKILMFVDNCSAHGDIPTLKNVKVQFLPPNTTSKLQPLDQGIIKNFKVLYRKEVVRQYLRNIEEKNPTTINVLNAMWMTSKAWANVTQTTIENSFKKSGFKRQTEGDEERVEEEGGVVGTPSVSTHEIPDRWEDVTRSLNVEGLTFEEFVNFDNDLAICGELSDTDIIASVSQSTGEDANEDSEEDSEAEVPDPEPDPTLRDARCTITTLKKFIQKKTEVTL